MLQSILSISGKPGLFKMVSRGKNMLIVEGIGENKRRMPVYATDKVISLADVAMYTDEGETPLRDVLTSIKDKENGAACSLNVKEATGADLSDYFATVLPDYDRDRVHLNDIKKLIKWYNLLIANGYTDFQKEETTEE